MWPRQSHTVVTLTISIYIKITLTCMQVKQDDFDEIKRIVARNTLLTYPDFNEKF